MATSPHVGIPILCATSSVITADFSPNDSIFLMVDIVVPSSSGAVEGIFCFNIFVDLVLVYFDRMGSTVLFL